MTNNNPRAKRSPLAENPRKYAPRAAVALLGVTALGGGVGFVGKEYVAPAAEYIFHAAEYDLSNIGNPNPGVNHDTKLPVKHIDTGLGEVVPQHPANPTEGFVVQRSDQPTQKTS